MKEKKKLIFCILKKSYSWAFWFLSKVRAVSKCYFKVRDTIISPQSLRPPKMPFFFPGVMCLMELFSEEHGFKYTFQQEYLSTLPFACGALGQLTQMSDVHLRKWYLSYSILKKKWLARSNVDFTSQIDIFIGICQKANEIWDMQI